MDKESSGEASWAELLHSPAMLLANAGSTWSRRSFTFSPLDDTGNMTLLTEIGPIYSSQATMSEYTL